LISHKPLTELQRFAGIFPDMTEEYIQDPDMPHYVVDGANVIIDQGGIKKTHGFNRYSGLSSPIGAGQGGVIELLWREKIGDSHRHLIALTEDKVYLITSSGYTLLGNRLPSLAPVTGANIVDTLYFADAGSRKIYKYNDAGLALFSDGTKQAKYIMAHKLWLILMNLVVGEEELPSTLWFSNPAVPETFDDVDRLTITSSGEILGGRSLEDNIAIYTDEGVYLLYFISDTFGWGVKRIGNIGLKSPLSLCGSDAVHYYMSEDGFNMLSSGNIPQPISWKRFNKFLIEDVNPVLLGSIRGTYVPEKHLLVVGYADLNHTSINKLLMYDTIQNELVGKKDVYDVNCMTSYNEQVFLGTVPGYVLVDGERFTDLESSFTSYVEFPIIYFGLKTNWKRVLEVDVTVEKADGDLGFDVELIDGGSPTREVEVSFTFPSDRGIHTVKGYTDINANSFKIYLKDVNTSCDYRITSILLRGYEASPK